ncbi:Trp biosynthesis-associated membrane protein [Cellulosimicrobium terreum]|nr:Trp biosynthesis-associated membrane protein [Cellulosimicrobium terreum]
MSGPGRRTAIWSLLLLGGATLAASAPTWLTTTGSTPTEPVVDVAVSGTTAAPAVGAAALVVVAAALALGLVGRVARWLVLVVAAASGAVTVASALGVALDPVPAARSAVAEATSVTEPTSPVDVTAAPWVAVVLGVLTVVAVVWIAVGARSWTTASTRHERVPASGAQADASPHADATPGPPSAPGTARPAEPDPTDHDTWDALTRGEDPTDGPTAR